MEPNQKKTSEVDEEGAERQPARPLQAGETEDEFVERIADRVCEKLSSRFNAALRQSMAKVGLKA